MLGLAAVVGTVTTKLVAQVCNPSIQEAET